MHDASESHEGVSGFMAPRENGKEITVGGESPESDDVNPVPERCSQCASSSVHFQSIVSDGEVILSWCCTRCGHKWPVHAEPPEDHPPLR